MKNKTWSQLESKGWSRVVNETFNDIVYKRPSCKKVRRKRDLSEIELLEFGDILFPGKRQKIRSTFQPRPPQPEVPRVPDIPEIRSEVFVVDDTESSKEVKGPNTVF